MFNEKTWKDGERLAADYMKKQGYKIIYTNFKCSGVELDIVALCSKKMQYRKLKAEFKEKIKNAKNLQIKRNLIKKLKNSKKFLEDILVITEVKSRSSDKYGLGFEAVGKTKQNHIARGADYLCKLRQFKDIQVRFDVASVDGGVLTYIEDAF